MGIMNKFNDPKASKALHDELKSKVGIPLDDEQISAEDNTTKGEQGEKQGGKDQNAPTGTKKAEAETPDHKVKELPKKGNTKKSINQTSKRKESTSVKQTTTKTVEQDEELTAFLEAFKKTYKQSEKDNRMLRIQRKNYKELVKLKVDNIAISEFVNFAISFTLKSNHFDAIVKQLK